MDTSLRAQLSRGLTQEETIGFEKKDVAIALNYLHLFKSVPIVHRDISSGEYCSLKKKKPQVNPGAPIYAATEASTNSQTTKVNRKSEAWEGK